MGAYVDEFPVVFLQNLAKDYLLLWDTTICRPCTVTH